MQPISSGDKIIFRTQYFDSFLYHRGEVISQSDKWLSVKYSEKIETHKGYESVTHVTDIPMSFVVNENQHNAF